MVQIVVSVYYARCETSDILYGRNWGFIRSKNKSIIIAKFWYQQVSQHTASVEYLQ